MEPLAFFRRVIAWRWTPCVAPVTGSVLIALLTLALVPDEIGGAEGTGPLALRAKHDVNADAPAEDLNESAPAPNATTLGRHPGLGHGRPRMPADAVQGFFHKAQELPVEPVDPSPPPPPPEPPPPAPTATVYQLPEPVLAAPPTPPASPDLGEPGMLPPPNVPLPAPER